MKLNYNKSESFRSVKIDDLWKADPLPAEQVKVEFRAAWKELAKEAIALGDLDPQKKISLNPLTNRPTSPIVKIGGDGRL